MCGETPEFCCYCDDFQDRLDRLHRRSMGTMGTTSNLTNPRVQLAAACVLQGRLETQAGLRCSGRQLLINAMTFR